MLIFGSLLANCNLPFLLKVLLLPLIRSFFVQFSRCTFFSLAAVVGSTSRVTLRLSAYVASRVDPIASSLAAVVGSSGLEPPTSRLSGVRSNHLSYEPISIRTSGVSIHILSPLWWR